MSRMSLIPTALAAYVVLLLALAWVVIRNGGFRPTREDYAFMSLRRALAASPPYERRGGPWRTVLAASVSVVLIVLVLVDGRAESTATATVAETVAPQPTERVAPPAPTPSEVAEVRYTIAPGDTLSAIAGRFGVPVASLLEANQLANADQLAAGQVLVIPAPPR
jgi:LysM repeat protein